MWIGGAVVAAGGAFTGNLEIAVPAAAVSEFGEFVTYLGTVTIGVGVVCKLLR